MNISINMLRAKLNALPWCGPYKKRPSPSIRDIIQKSYPYKALFESVYFKISSTALYFMNAQDL